MKSPTNRVALWKVWAGSPGPFCVRLLVSIWLYIQHGVQLLGGVSQQALQVADKAVHVALTRCLVDDIFVIIVAKATAQFLIIHLRLVFPLSPSPGHL